MIIPVLGNLQMLLLLQSAMHTYVPPVCRCSYMKQAYLLQHQRRHILHLARPPLPVYESVHVCHTSLDTTSIAIGLSETMQASAGGNLVVLRLNMVSNKDMR